MVFSKSSIYIVGRTTKTKQNIIARDFNLKNPLLTHIGLGLLQNSSFKIYNVSDYLLNDNGSALMVEALEDFTSLDDITNCSIWEKEITTSEIKRIKEKLEYYLNKKIIFDDEFTLNNGNLYCSEFVYLILREIFPTDFNCIPTTKKLNLFYSRALRREYLKYIPVDFFQATDDFELIYSENY